jgi:hypothetical protein
MQCWLWPLEEDLVKRQSNKAVPVELTRRLRQTVDGIYEDDGMYAVFVLLSDNGTPQIVSSTWK